MIVGIDEAGKGPVIGPMCIGGVKIEESRAHIFKVLGVADSKKLTPKKREQLAAQIKKYADDYFILEVSADKIDELRKILTMNEIMVLCFSKVLEKLQPDVAYVDAADVKAERFSQNLLKQYAKSNPEQAEKIKIISHHKADAIYPIVSAASIITKVRRDELIEQLKKDMGVDFGSGYPSDQKTREFLLKWGREHGEVFPAIVRHSWQTIEKIKAELEKS